MKKMIFISYVFICLIFFLTAGDAFAQKASQDNIPSTLVIGCSSIGSTSYIHSVGMANIISKYTKMSATAQSSGGSDALNRAIKAGKVDVALVNTFSAGNAYRGTKQFAKDGKIPVLMWAFGYKPLRQTLARADRGIKTVPDLNGKRFIALRKSLPELEMVADAMLKSYRIDKKEVTYLQTASTTETEDALISGSVDAAVIPGGVPTGNIMKLVERIKINFVNIPADKMEIILEYLGPDFSEGVIPAGTYKDQETDLLFPALGNIMVVRADFSEEAVYWMTKSLFDHHDEFKSVHSAAKEWNVENTLRYFNIPLHPGAIRYFKEKGRWTTAHDKRQQNLQK